jgi:hypothetical protein
VPELEVQNVEEDTPIIKVPREIGRQQIALRCQHQIGDTLAKIDRAIVASSTYAGLILLDVPRAAVVLRLLTRRRCMAFVWPAAL